VVSILRSDKSPVNFEKCGAGDWSLTGFFFITMICVVIYSAKKTAIEQSLKMKYGEINIVDSDLIFKGKVLKYMLGMGFGAGWVAGALGLGGGVILNPLLLALGVPPKVSSATGMYLIMFSTISTSFFYVIFDQLVIDYALWIASWSTLGAIIGLAGMNWYIKKFKR